MMRSSRRSQFGIVINRASQDGGYSPGPIYAPSASLSACSKQVVSSRRSAPTAKFPRQVRRRHGRVRGEAGEGPSAHAHRLTLRAHRPQARFSTGADAYQRSTPGPGDYLT